MTDPIHPDPAQAILDKLSALEQRVASLPTLGLPPMVRAELESALLVQVDDLEDQMRAIEAGR